QGAEVEVAPRLRHEGPSRLRPVRGDLAHQLVGCRAHVFLDHQPEPPVAALGHRLPQARSDLERHLKTPKPGLAWRWAPGESAPTLQAAAHRLAHKARAYAHSPLTRAGDLVGSLGPTCNRNTSRATTYRHRSDVRFSTALPTRGRPRTRG